MGLVKGTRSQQKELLVDNPGIVEQQEKLVLGYDPKYKINIPEFMLV